MVGKEVWGWGEVGGGEVQRLASFWIDHVDSAQEEAENLDENHRCLEISNRRLDWWEIEHWDEIYDERHSWGDLSREDQRELNKLLGKR